MSTSTSITAPTDRAGLAQQNAAAHRRLITLRGERERLEHEIAEAQQAGADRQLLAAAGMPTPGDDRLADLRIKLTALATEDGALVRLREECDQALSALDEQDRQAKAAAEQQARAEAEEKRRASLGRVERARAELADALKDAGGQPFGNWLLAQPAGQNVDRCWLQLLAREQAPCLDSAATVAEVVHWADQRFAPWPARALQHELALFVEAERRALGHGPVHGEAPAVAPRPVTSQDQQLRALAAVDWASQQPPRRR